MKQVVSNYSYSPATNVVTLTGVNIDQDQLLLVVAPQVGRTMYNFASGVTGAVSAGADTRITLNASTVGLTTTSPLVIFYDDQQSTQTVSGTVTISNLPANQAIFGTVTANVVGLDQIDGETKRSLPVVAWNVNVADDPALGNVVPVQITNISGGAIGSGNPLSISGTVTVGAMPNGSLTTRFGSVTTANTAQITSAVTNSSRKYLLVQNIATSTVTIGIGFSPTTTQGIQLAAGAGLTFDAFCPTGAVYWLSGVTGSNWSVLEG